MRMKQVREANKNPKYRHSCDCLGADYEYITELPETSNCLNPKYFEKTNEGWVDVSCRVRSD